MTDQEKERSPDQEIEAFIKEIRDLSLWYGDRSDWYCGFGEKRFAELDRETQRFYMDLASYLEYLGSFGACCMYLRMHEQDLFEQFKYYEERHVPFPAPERLERMWQLRQVRSFLCCLHGCKENSESCEKCLADHPLKKHLL